MSGVFSIARRLGLPTFRPLEGTVVSTSTLKLQHEAFLLGPNAFEDASSDGDADIHIIIIRRRRYQVPLSTQVDNPNHHSGDLEDNGIWLVGPPTEGRHNSRMFQTMEKGQWRQRGREEGDKNVYLWCLGTERDKRQG
jgi:hypothetical protein